MIPLLIAASLLASPSPAESVAVGAEAPNFTLTDVNGKSHNLSDFRGKYVVLEWTNEGCPFVIKHYSTQNMQAAQKKATDMGAIWLSIVSSAPGKQGHITPETGKALYKRGGFKSTALLMDEDGAVARQFKAKTTPHMYVIDPKGVLRYMGAVDDRPTPQPEDVKGAKNYVLAALTELMAGKDVSVTATQPYGCSVKLKN